MTLYAHTLTTDCPLDTLCEAIERLGYFWIQAEGTPEEPMHGDVTLDGDLRETPYDELCPRCMRPMVWVTSSWHCLCGFHSGCCEGEPQS